LGLENSVTVYTNAILRFNTACVHACSLACVLLVDMAMRFYMQTLNVVQLQMILWLWTVMYVTGCRVVLGCVQVLPRRHTAARQRPSY